MATVSYVHDTDHLLKLTEVLSAIKTNATALLIYIGVSGAVSTTQITLTFATAALRDAFYTKIQVALDP